MTCDSGGVADLCFRDFSHDKIRESLFDKKISSKLFFPKESEDSEILTNVDLKITSFGKIGNKFFEEFITPVVFGNDYKEVRINKCYKIRFKPSKVQINYFKKCMKAHNFFYNLSVPILNELRSKISRIDLRNEVMKNGSINENSTWLDEIFYDTKEMAINDARIMHKSALANQKGKSFSMKCKEETQQRGYFNVGEKAIKIINTNGKTFEISIFKKNLKIDSSIILKDRRLKRINCLKTCKILKNGSKYYFCIPVVTRLEEFFPTNKVISIDPGERCPLTGFDGQEMYEFGKGTRLKVMNKFKQIDSLNTNIFSKEDKIKVKKYKRCQKKLRNINSRISGIIDNFHKQIASFLTNNFDTIILPIFQTKNIIETNLNKQSKRNLQRFAHYRFREVLRQHCLRRGKRLILVDEYYTTATCGNCGTINDVGSKKEFICDGCDVKCHRDLNAARNIFMRFVKFHSKALK